MHYIHIIEYYSSIKWNEVLFSSFILYVFQVHGLVVKQPYTLYSVPLSVSGTLNGAMHSYCNIIDYISYALLTSPWLFCNYKFVL